ncbi:transposase [Kineococcus xinjiangensis]|uniref:Transposase n=1 Tax=Kineococcus xinjiangensis TaxID=512762 RepID=A0A2S6IJ31_9ACTN|nr:IS110 family transposase [Kineococcus xinjiangensis]PPK94232.1 transposase [Kineococcus xinjiangensis]
MSVEQHHSGRREATATAAKLTAGIDWSSTHHAIALVDEHGGQVQRLDVEHTAAGLRRLVHCLQQAAVTGVGIERGDGPLVDVLLEAGLTVFVIAPNQVRNLRRRYGSAGNKDDAFDAYVLADTVRTDRLRLRPLTPDSPATVTLRMSVRARQDFVAARVAMANQLRAHLQHVLPGAIGLFSHLDSAVSLAFLTRFPTQDRADWLSPRRLENWLRTQRYCNPRRADVLHAHLVAAARGATGPEAEARAGVTAALVAGLSCLRQQIAALDEDIAQQLARHPDAVVFTSLPKAGVVRAARLLAEMGDARGRFPTPESLACLAGATPSTRQSGKVKVVAFRWAVDKQLRGAVMDFAGDSHHANTWAADLYQRARAKNHSHSHATRILARAWLHVIWRCWQDGVAYDPARHRALQALEKSAA